MTTHLTPIRMRELGTLGFWAESDELDGPEFASTLTNAVFDTKGRVAARKGWDAYLSSAVTGTPTVEKLHYYSKEIGDTEFWVGATETGSTYKLWKFTGAAGAGAATDITGAITAPSGSDWQFVNYNNLVVGIQQGDTPVSWNGTGNFADYGSGTLPDGNCLMSAWGRLFATDADGQVIRWTATLGSDFDAVGAGSLNVRLVWPNGKDRVIAIRAFNGRLVIFGQKSILVYGDDASSQLDAGVDPNSSSFNLKETVENVGLYARDAVVEVGNDLLFLTPNGVRSLRRAVDYEFHPVEGVTKSLNPFIEEEIEDTAPEAKNCSMTYDQSRGMVLLRVEQLYFYLDVRQLYTAPNDPTRQPFYRAALWTGIAWKGIAYGDDRALRFGFDAGLVGEYGGYLDNASQYTLDLSSVWLSLERGEGEGERLKFLKRLLLIASTTKSYTVNIRWAWDFSADFATKSIAVNQDAAPAEWGLGEWGDDEWAGRGAGLYRGTTTGSGSGTYMKVGFSIAINDASFAYNSLSTQVKLGRLTR